MTEEWHGLTYIYREISSYRIENKMARVEAEKHLRSYSYNSREREFRSSGANGNNEKW